MTIMNLHASVVLVSTHRDGQLRAGISLHVNADQGHSAGRDIRAVASIYLPTGLAGGWAVSAMGSIYGGCGTGFVIPVLVLIHAVTYVGHDSALCRYNNST